MKKSVNILLVALLGLSFFSCEEEEADKQTYFVGTYTIDAQAYDSWKYFSFESMDTVTITDPAASTGWDIAVHRHNFRTNSGASGTGNGGVIDMGEVEMHTVVDIPTGTFVEDGTISILLSPAMPPSYVDASGSEVLDAVIIGMGGVATLSNKVYIVRCADGESYVKIKVTDYRSGVIDFEYEYATDATRGFQE